MVKNGWAETGSSRARAREGSGMVSQCEASVKDQAGSTKGQTGPGKGKVGSDNGPAGSARDKQGQELSSRVRKES